MAYKKRAITHNRDCEERLEYWVVSDEETITKCAPMKWHKLKLEDQTTPTTKETAAKLRYCAVQTQFNKRVDDNAWLRTANPPTDQRYQALCAHVGITY